MPETVILILLLMLVPLILQLFVFTTYWHRVAGILHRAADKPPFNTWLTIEAIGEEPRAVTRLLERRTRLDMIEIDTIVMAGGGRLPLPMSRPAALRLAQELRQLGAEASITEREIAVTSSL